MMKTTIAVLVVLAAWRAAPLALAHDVEKPPPLTPAQLEEIDRIFKTPTRIGYWQGGSPVDPNDAAAFIDFLSRASGHEGPPTNLYKSVAVAPAHFAPAIREAFRHVPPTLEAYIEDSERPFGERREYYWPLMLVPYLGRELAEPILRKFADAILPLALEARRRFFEVDKAYWATWEAAGRPVGDAWRREPNAAPVVEEWEVTAKASTALATVWGGAVRVAGELGSPIFVDDGVAMLVEDDPILHHWGVWMAGYMVKFANERPEGVAALRAEAARLRRSEDLDDQLSAVSIEIALDPARDANTDPELRRLKDQIKIKRQR